MVALFVISAVIMAAYNAFAVARVGVPSSLSSTFYLLPSPWRHLFCVSLIAAALTLVAPWVEVTEERYEFLPFLACAMLAGVASAPWFKERDNGFHHVFALLCAIFSLLWVSVAFGWSGAGLIALTLALTQCAFFLAVGRERYSDCLVYRLEIFAFLTTYIAVGIKVL